MTSVGIYLRISEDRDGTQTATSRQREDCTRFVTANGWTVAEEFEDVDLSASKRKVVRPAFERMITAVTNREIDGVVSWRQDRLQRTLRDFVRLNDACEDAGGFIVTLDGVDTRNLGGQIMAPILTVMAAAEARNISGRVARWHRERATSGKANGGGQRPFGYTLGRREVIEDEAVLIREAAQRIFDGESIRGIQLDWARRGVVTPTGKLWGPATLRRMLITWGLAGQREYQGTLTPGVWTPILTVAQTERLRAILMDPARQNPGVRAARSYLLTGGVARCGKCGEALIGRPGYRNARRYTCAKEPGRPNCGGIARLAVPVEDLVAEMMFEALAGVDVSQFIEHDTEDEHDQIAAEIRADDEKLVELADDYYTKRAIGRPEFFSQREKLTTRLEANRQRLARSARTSPLAGMVDVGKEVAARWPHETLQWKRTIVAALIDSVIIGPAQPGRATFDKSAITVSWKF